LKSLRIGTRGSPLALWQANHVRDLLIEFHGIACELVRIRTSGDRFQTGSVTLIGNKGVFIKELEDALLGGEIDLAVHSMKDVPSEIPAGLDFPAITKREDPRDCVIARTGQPIRDLPAGARVGTSSLRRQAQLRHLRPDFEMSDLRGNVDTRVKKLFSGEFEAVVLALAGITRLGARDKVTEVLSTRVMLPAAGQGALGIETRTGDSETATFVAPLDDADARASVSAERALLRELQGGCQVPLGAFARIAHGESRNAGNGSSEPDSAEILIEGAVFSPDGREFVRLDARGSWGAPEALGKRLGQALLDAGAGRILRLAGRSVGKN
jgi:hydroxymethylbilane synthase